ncbi:hypothetical protein Hanom_Chr06g00564051 [Helianthus anomalus]
MKKKVTVDAGATSKKAGGGRTTTEIPKKGTLRFHQSNLEDYVVASDSLEGLLDIGEKPQGSAAAASKSAGSAWFKALTQARPLLLCMRRKKRLRKKLKVEGEKLVARKRSREEAVATTPSTQKAAISKPIGKQGRLRSLYRFSPEALKKPEVKASEPEAKKTKFTIIPPKDCYRRREDW